MNYIEHAVLDIPGGSTVQVVIVPPQAGRLGTHGWVISDRNTGQVLNSDDRDRSAAVHSAIRYVSEMRP